MTDLRKILINNIGKIVSGDLVKPLIDADSILIEDGIIKKIGNYRKLKIKKVETVVDANRMVVTPGLIDPHTHPSIGDWTPRQRTLGWMESALHGGVTTILSQGEVHVQGRPRDAIGTKSMAILASKTFYNAKPGGIQKVHGGALILEEGLTERDFKEMKEAGVWLVAEIGGSGLYKPEDVLPYVKMARKYSMKISMHFGGPSVPGSAYLSADDVIKVNPDVVVHINGGTTSPSLSDIKKLIYKTNLTLEVIHNGNPRTMFEAVEMMKKENLLHRLILGSDTPVGSGVIPLAILRLILSVSSLNDISAEKTIALATGNTARVYGLNTGMIEEGREADILVMDCPLHGVGKDALEAIHNGDMPAITMIMIDGKIVALRGRNTPMGARKVRINGKEDQYVNYERHMYGL